VDASRLSRRTLLGAGVTSAATAAMLLSGCAGTRDADAEPGQASADSGDLDLADAARSRESDFRGLCLRIRRRHPALADRLDEVIPGLSTHEEALAQAIPDGESTTLSGLSAMPPVPRREAKAADLVAATAARLHRRCLADSVEAESGALARLLASIAASHAVTAQAWGR